MGFRVLGVGLGMYRDNGKEHGSYYSGVILWDYDGVHIGLFLDP